MSESTAERMRPRRPWRRIALAASLLALGSGLLAAAPAAAAEQYYGISAPELYSMSLDGRRALRDLALAQIRMAGIEAVRTEIGWRDVEPQAPTGGAHTYRWAAVDEHVEALARQSLTEVPMMLAPPGWAQPAASANACQRRGGVAPERVDDYARFVGAVAARYGRGGSFWQAQAADRPSLPQRPIRTYEIWNEPNFDPFWCPEIDPETYARALAAAADAIHAADPQATVSVGGLVLLKSDMTRGSHVVGMATRTFLERMVAAVPALPEKVDAVAVHLYGADPGTDVSLLGWASEQLDAVGLGDAPLLITELGWHTGAGANGVTETARAAMLADLVDRLTRATDCDLIGIYPHEWISPQVDPLNPEHWFGIADPLTGVPLATGVAYITAIATHPGGEPTGPELDVCATGGSTEPGVDEPTAPALTLSRRRSRSPRTARFRLGVDGGSEVARLEYRVDGSRWRATDGRIVVRRVRRGRHRLDARAFDVSGARGDASIAWRARK